MQTEYLWVRCLFWNSQKTGESSEQLCEPSILECIAYLVMAKRRLKKGRKKEEEKEEEETEEKKKEKRTIS